MSRKSILVTGGTGLVGTGLLQKLKRSYSDITLLVRNLPSISIVNHSGFKLIKGDISDLKSLKKVRSHFDIIFHLAASKRMFEKDGELRKANINGLKNALEAFCSHGRETLFVFASSIDAGIRKSDYAKTKLEGEAIVKNFAKKHPQLKYLNLRIGQVYDRLGKSLPKEVADLIKKGNWRGRLLYHELGNKYLYPMELSRLSKKMVDLISKPELFCKTTEIYDRKVRVASLVKNPPLRQRFGRFILPIWHLLGRITRRGDLLIYLRSEK